MAMITRGLGIALIAGLGACGQIPGPEQQGQIYKGAVNFVEAYAIAKGCDSLALDEAKVRVNAGALLDQLEAEGVSTADVTAYLNALPEGAVEAEVASRLAKGGLSDVNLKEPTPDPRFCSLGNRARAQGTAAGRMLTDAS